MEPDTMLWQTCAITVLFSLQSSGSIQWPAGTYGIPKSIAGCPQADGFQWQTGWRLQSTNNHKPNNSRSPQFHIDGEVNKATVNRSFCMKGVTIDDKDRPEWPQGKYCIYKNGNCPKGLRSGWVFWNDDKEFDLNKKGGLLPDGVYRNRITEIHFCCRTDGDKDDPILLPFKSPFFLLAYESAKCQMVKWAVASLEWIYYYTTDRNNDDQRNGSYPYNAGKMHPTIYYCYYQGCKENLTGISGSVKSPNYPNHYPNGQYCSWKITANTTQQIHLVFNTFNLQNEKHTDELRVYDGENETGEELGVFYGGHPPPNEGIYSSSSQMFLIFKSDKNDSYTGFSASYFVVNKTVGSRGTVTEAQIPEVPTSATQIPEDTSLHVLTSKTSTAPKMTPSSTATTLITESSKVVSSPVVPGTTAKTLKVTSSSSTRFSEMAPSSYVISMTLQTPEVATAHTLIKTTPRGCNETLTTVSGTFQSPNYPRNYPNGQYCFWGITVITAQQINLIFSGFSLQIENNTDVLYVYDGDDATGEALEVLYGGHPPPEEGICISSNRIFVVFKSDKEESYHGFRASYYGVNNSESCGIAISQSSKENGKRDERKEPHRKGLNVVPVVVPVAVLSAILLAILLVARICYMRKRRKRVEGPEEEILLRKRRKRVEGPEEEILLRERRKRVEGPEDEILIRKRTRTWTILQTDTIYCGRKKRKRVEQPDDENSLRLISEPIASCEDTEL